MEWLLGAGLVVFYVGVGYVIRPRRNESLRLVWLHATLWSAGLGALGGLYQRSVVVGVGLFLIALAGFAVAFVPAWFWGRRERHAASTVSRLDP